MKRHVSAVRGDASSNPCVATHGGGAQGHNLGVLPGGGIAHVSIRLVLPHENKVVFAIQRGTSNYLPHEAYWNQKHLI
jgi:hypothetical protein